MTYHQLNLPITHNAISLPELASGPSRYDKLVGLIPDLSGPDRARASLSARQVKEKALLMSGICGQTGTTSLQSADLQQSLENRLRARTVSTGSTLYKLTWKERVSEDAARRECLQVLRDLGEPFGSSYYSWSKADAIELVHEGILSYSEEVFDGANG